MLTGPGSSVVGSADHQAAAGTHDATGAIVGPGAVVTGSANRSRTFAASGALVGPGSVITGSAARVAGAVTHAATGALVGQGSIVTGTAARANPPVSHDATGALVGPGSIINGQAQNGVAIIDTHDGFWAREYRKMFERKPTIAEVVEIVQERPQEAIEAVREVVEQKYPDIDYTQVLNSVKIQRFIAKQLLIALELKRIEDDEQDIEDILLLL